MNPLVPVFLTVGLVAAVGALVAPATQPINKSISPPPPAMRPVDHPLCFPPGTPGTERFALCPDSLPKEGQA